MNIFTAKTQRAQSEIKWGCAKNYVGFNLKEVFFASFAVKFNYHV